MDFKHHSCDIRKITPQIQQQLARIIRTHDQWDDIFNILLVFTCVRRAYFAEHYDKDLKRLIKSILKILNRSKWKPPIKVRKIGHVQLVYLDPKLDKVKSLTDKELGFVLGFHCVGHDYRNQNVDRLGLHISIERDGLGSEVYAEFCVVDEKNSKQQYNEIEKFMKNKTEQYQKVAKLFGFNVTYRINDEPGDRKLTKSLDNDQYVKEHFHDYMNAIWNNFTITTMFEDMDYEDVIKARLLQLFKFVFWTSTSLRLYEDLYVINQLTQEERNRTTMEQRHEMAAPTEQLLKEFETDLASHPELLKLPYNKWLDSPILKEIVRTKYPELVSLFV